MSKGSSWRDKVFTVMEVSPPPRMNLTETIRSLSVGQAVRFPPEVNTSSIRTIAWSLGMRLQLRKLKTKETLATCIEIKNTKKVEQPIKEEQTEEKEKIYDL